MLVRKVQVMGVIKEKMFMGYKKEVQNAKEVQDGFHAYFILSVEPTVITSHGATILPWTVLFDWLL